jgi:hypothetical protein
MPSPFPGMDPYLEEPGLWPDVHHELISVMRESLNAQLRPKYFARIEDRVYISDERDPGRRVIIPDLRVVGSDRGGQLRARPVGPAIAMVEPLEVTTLIEDEIHESRIEVIDRLEKSVVTVIEVLSPTNKVPGSRGRASYEAKREQVMHSSSHFVEMDLLRDGEGFPPYEALPPHEYRVHVSRVERRPRGTLWPIRLDQSLPEIPIPLHKGDADAKVDLQQALTVVYEHAAYDLDIDYRADPSPPLPATYLDWADRLLGERG